MSHFVEFIKTLVPHFPSQQEQDAQYLSESVDACDVERRLFEIDHRSGLAAQQQLPLGGALH